MADVALPKWMAARDLPLIIGPLNPHHNPPPVPLRRDGHAALLNWSAEQTVRRMTLDLAVKPFLGFTPANKMLSQSGEKFVPPNEPTGC